MAYLVEVYEDDNFGKPDLLGRFEFDVPPRMNETLILGSKEYSVIRAQHVRENGPPGAPDLMRPQVLVAKN